MRQRAGSSWRAVLFAIAVVLVGVTIAAGTADGAASGSSQTVRVTIKDFRIKSKTTTVRAGSVTFQVENHGPSTHKFNIDQTDLPADQLPLRPDGITVNEESPALARAGSINQLALGDSTSMTVRLKPGHYVLYCNLEGHYLSGMHFALDVK